MKLKSGIVTDQIDKDQFVAVATGEAAKSFSGMIRNNKTAAFLFELLREEQSEDSLVEALLQEYEVSEEVARQDVRRIVKQIREAGILND